MKQESRSTMVNSGSVFVGCMFIGMGIGFIFNAITPGVLIGMGVGFIWMSLLKREKDDNQNT